MHERGRYGDLRRAFRWPGDGRRLGYVLGGPLQHDTRQPGWDLPLAGVLIKPITMSGMPRDYVTLMVPPA